MLQFPNKKYHLTFIFLLLTGGIFAQVSSPSAGQSGYIVYKTAAGTDSARVFTWYEFPGDDVSGVLTATAPSAGNFSFEWSAFDTLSLSFGPVFQTDGNSGQSTAAGLETGGYRVRVSDGAGTDTSFIAWVFIDDMDAHIEKTPSGNVLPYKYTCDFLVMSGMVTLDTFYIYDPGSGDKIRMQLDTEGNVRPVNGFRFLWTSDNPDLVIPNADRVLDPNTSYLPPYKDTWYFLTVTDSFGMTVRDSVFYESIQVKSEFSFEFFDKADKEEFVTPSDPTEDDAPLRVRFTNRSQNGASFEWIFSDTLKSDFFANELTGDMDYQPEYTYLIPHDYYPALVATSQEGCVDTFRVEKPIIVSPSELKVPNVFTPNGDDINDYFKVNFKSIKQFNIYIYSRSGALVYKAGIDDLYSWDGWDGHVKDSNREASPGPYYYVIEARGYDNIKYQRGVYRGVVYLYR